MTERVLPGDPEAAGGRVEAPRLPEAAWETLFHNIPEALFVAGPSGQILRMNPAARRFHDMPETWENSLPLADLERHFEVRTLDGDLLPAADWPLSRALRGERFISIRAQVLNRQTGRCWVGSYAGTPVFNESGRFILAVVTIRDETMLVRAERALAESQERLTAALAASKTGTFRWDLRSNEVYCDSNLTALFGLPATGRTAQAEVFLAKLDEADRDAMRARLARSTEEGIDLDVEFQVAWPDGAVHWLLARGQVFRDAQGRPAYMSGACHDITGRKEAELRQGLLMAELDHRVKNVLAVVNSLVAQTARSHRTVEDFVRAIRGRIGALARSHSLLSQSRWSGADLHELVAGEIAAFEQDFAQNVTIEGPAVTLRNKAAQSLSMVLHELATNAAKYGAFTHTGGRLRVSWDVTSPEDCEAQLVLCWEERGGPSVAPPVGEGFGCMLISRSLAYELKGEARLDFRPEGLVCTMTMPLGQVGQFASSFRKQSDAWLAP